MRTSRGVILGAIATSLLAVVPAMPVVAAPTAPQAASALAAGNEGTFYPVTPSRILDTREGNGAPKAPVGPGATIDLQASGRGGVPSTGVMAVVLNVTVHMPTAWGHVTVWPTGVTRPMASSLNFPPGWVGANSVTVALGTGGKVSLFNSAGNTHLIADVVGWYAQPIAPAPGATMWTTEPFRAFDSRNYPTKFGPGDWVTLGIDFTSVGANNADIKAWVINVTSTEADTPGFVTAWDGNPTYRPLASTLNLAPGRTVPNMAVVPARVCTEPDCDDLTGLSSIGLYTNGFTHLIVDVFAVYETGTDFLRFAGNTPTRIVDSRDNLGTSGPLAGGTAATITTPNALVDENTFGLVLNVTGIQPTVDTFMSVWANGYPQPEVSNLNPSAGQIVPNAVITEVDDLFKFNVYNNGGSVHFLVDVVGRFYLAPPATAGGAAARAGVTRSVSTANVVRH